MNVCEAIALSSRNSGLVYDLIVSFDLMMVRAYGKSVKSLYCLEGTPPNLLFADQVLSLEEVLSKTPDIQVEPSSFVRT